ncbi:trafficking protein particle complex subunit 10 [Xylariales sp. PMI_506]|nr:trafficking protein particle complex subunit 10 [Xylariales sp. PMI_506]
MEQPFSTSKVTVEYFDPYDVYRLIAPGLIPRLPLRNLHWQSHAGPLRSIDSLHIELVSNGSGDSRPAATPDSAFPPLKRSESSSTSRENSDGFQTQIGAAPGAEAGGVQQAASKRNSAPARRHQIPGLRRTPYLKVLLVRCDDNDSYKTTVRQEIRDWIKEETPASGSSKKTRAENHDAFEWLILHVVVPNTAAASQPRIAKSDSGTSEKSTVAKWRGTSSTLLEKLRSDFNSSSKGAPDRIAQIRIGINDLPYDVLPRVVPAVPSNYKETAEESENAWNELMGKMRSLILTSFDMRVTQYEEDIKEKDGQRSLPGWNFCTFFILKEGLARGFESVGLVEDALVGYDELSVGLDMVIKEQAGGQSGASANALLTYTGDLQEAAHAAAAAGGDDTEEVVDMQASASNVDEPKEAFDELPISSTKKPYRELILENNVSVFDFRCYIFSRQVALLQRLGNVWSSREELLSKLKEQQDAIIHGVAPRAPPPKQVDNDNENLSMLAEICRRTLEFIPAVSQVMRNDLQTSLTEKKKNGEEDLTPTQLSPAVAEIIDNLVASFAFSISQQILAQTSTKALPIPPSTLAPPDGHEPKSTIPEPKTMMHPARNSSLRVTTGGAGVGRPPPSPNIFPGPGGNAALAEHQAAKNSAFLKAGLEDLAARRAELYALSRNVLEECGKKRGWSDGWSTVPVIAESSLVDMVDISLDDDESTAVPESKPTSDYSKTTLSGIRNQLLRTALDANEDFYKLYETLTDKALRHYTVANHTHSVQACLSDLAILKYHLGDYGAASSYFWRTTPFYGESGWTLLELSMLIMYSQCLKQLQRKEEYVKVVLKLLSKSSSAERDRLDQKTYLHIGKRPTAKYPDNDAIKGFLGDLLSETKGLSSEVQLPLFNFFSSVEVDGTLEYHDGKDSFSISLKLNSLLVDELKIDKARVRLVGQIAGAEREIWLELSNPAAVKPGKNKLKLDSKAVIPGKYEVDKIDLTASNLCLHYQRPSSQSLKKGNQGLKSPQILVYQRPDALDVKLTASSHIQLDKNNTVDIELNSGWNELTSAEVRVKASTGGLRLLSAEAKCINTDLDFSRPPGAGLFHFDKIPARTALRIRFPYTVEQEVLNVSIRIDVSYTTPQHGTFSFSRTPSVPISLDLGVNVQDIFKHKALYSKFTVSTATPSPLRLFKSELQSSDIFYSSFGLPPSQPVVVFPRQPGSLLYKITRKKTEQAATTPAARTMYLKLYYSVLQDEIAALIETSITEALKETSLQHYGRLLVEALFQQARDGLDAFELERIVLLGSLSTDFVLDVNWARYFSGLGKDASGQENSVLLASFLQSWQAQHKSLALPQDIPLEPKSILIPVEVPSITIVHTTDIRLQPTGKNPGANVDPYPAFTTNELIPATLHLKWTRIWDTGTPVKDMADLEFSYEVTAPGDSWLIGGRRKGHFVIQAPSEDSSSSPAESGLTSTPETEADIPLLLIPQREGWLSYPSIDIREVTSSGDSHDGGPSPNGEPQHPHQHLHQPPPPPLNHCETDLKNLGETVRVIPDRERVTISLDASGPGGGPLVLEVERRGESSRVVA